MRNLNSNELVSVGGGIDFVERTTLGDAVHMTGLGTLVVGLPLSMYYSSAMPLFYTGAFFGGWGLSAITAETIDSFVFPSNVVFVQRFVETA